MPRGKKYGPEEIIPKLCEAAFKAIMTLPQPTAFNALVNGFDGECPYCRREFIQA